ncbi:N-methyl-L-tryptophan oxidase [Paenibacillus tuaregi]|uniref:N-methyl-L-tryptophan oxidase n=1 Tax=Paenibacillus tuaregi TaxID=1816681 RepID=UPI0021CBBDE9|nr:N-methyl-L-tryptophan oxidase [Paenibacillus tuaregi]
MVGAGSMGMSAGAHLARRGIRTLLIDAFDPPHKEGSHHGDTRLIRHAYHGGPSYIALAIRAHELWNELEEESGDTLLVTSGVINLSSPQVISYRERLEDSLRLGLRIEHLDAVEIHKRWPGFTVPEDYMGLYEPDAGYLLSERCVSAYRMAAGEAGAELLANTRVVRLEERGEGVSVHTDKMGIFHAAKVILSAGAWFQTLEPYVTLPITPVRKTVGWFGTAGAQFDVGRFPGFTLNTPEGGYYGFPNIAGAGLKIGRHDGGKVWSPGEPYLPFGSDPEDEGDLRKALEAYIPGAAGALKRGVVCKYERTPDEDFIIDRYDGYSHVWIAGGFSGHGFKFSSVVGEILADLAETGTTRHDIGLFSLSRFNLNK